MSTVSNVNSVRTEVCRNYRSVLFVQDNPTSAISTVPLLSKCTCLQGARDYGHAFEAQTFRTTSQKSAAVRDCFLRCSDRHGWLSVQRLLNFPRDPFCTNSYVKQRFPGSPGPRNSTWHLSLKQEDTPLSATSQRPCSAAARSMLLPTSSSPPLSNAALHDPPNAPSLQRPCFAAGHARLLRLRQGRRPLHRRLGAVQGPGGPGGRSRRVQHPADAVPREGGQRRAGGWPNVHRHSVAAPRLGPGHPEGHGAGRDDPGQVWPAGGLPEAAGDLHDGRAVGDHSPPGTG
jgi:hypothetical protein